MRISPTQFTVAQYCDAMAQNNIRVNRNYQRSDKVWPPTARSFLIETILMDYPIPKLSLHQITDVKSRKTIQEIIDGQQRSQAILEFYNDKLPISRTSDNLNIAGKYYSQLDDEYKSLFLGYSLSVDLFVSATDDEIREVFRRINSYTVPLNPEEQRHAIYQGPFKWFIYGLSKQNDQPLSDMGVFRQKDFIRMADTKFFTEVVHAVLYGISTTKSPDLNRIYKEYDSDFPQASQIKSSIDSAIDRILEWKEVHNSPLMKPYSFYSLLLATMHLLHPISRLNSLYEKPGGYNYDRTTVVTNLSQLSEALQSAQPDQKFRSFVDANTSKTNVKTQRQTRFNWFCKAFEDHLI